LRLAADPFAGIRNACGALMAASNWQAWYPHAGPLLGQPIQT
jgi:hypothetical protein